MPHRESQQSGRGRSRVVVPTLLLLYLAAYVAQTYRLPLTATLYGYGLIALIITGLLVLLVGHNRHDSGSHSALFSRKEIRPPLKPLGFLALTALYPFVMPLLGFVITTFALSVILLRLFGEKSIWKSVAIGMVLSVGFFIGVGGLLGIPLPSFAFARLPFAF